MTPHTLWKEPCLDDPFLTLPKLQPQHPPTLNTLQNTEKSPKIQVSDTFLQAWHTPPKNPHDPITLAQNLNIVSSTFRQLIILGQGQVNVSEKTGPHDMVTEMDQGIEMLYRIWIHKHYPHHKIIGEEGQKDRITSEDYVWYLDPIDGTSNFISGNKNVAVHACCVYQGKPFVSYVGLPFYDQDLLFYEGAPRCYPMRSVIQTPLIVGTEYLPTRLSENHRFETYISQSGAEAFRINSIGVHIHNLIQGKVTAFYKPKIKLWDLLAPLAFLDYHFPDQYTIELFIDNALKPYSPFSNDPAFVTVLNQKHADTCRVGDIIICPKHLYTLRYDLIELMKTHD